MLSTTAAGLSIFGSMFLTCASYTWTRYPGVETQGLAGESIPRGVCSREIPVADRTVAARCVGNLFWEWRMMGFVRLSSSNNFVFTFSFHSLPIFALARCTKKEEGSSGMCV